jgi:hypothetical protein
MTAAIALLIMRVQEGRGLAPYRASSGAETTALSTLIFVAIVAIVAGLGKLLGWWSNRSSHSGRRRGQRR